MTTSDRRFTLLLGALTLLFASIPYLWGWLVVLPPGHVYPGFPPQNIDDTAVYFAWMRQAENGQFFLRNQFTTEPQRGVLFNLFFLLLGNAARLFHLPLTVVYHGARVGCGALLLWAVAGLIGDTLRDGRARRIAFALVCVASGLGFFWEASRGENAGIAKPVDLWQPEAVTFLSLYMTPLFSAALACMVVFFRALLRAERTGRLRDAWPAAALGALLGNFHSYDVLHLFGVWGAYRIVGDIAARRVDPAGWTRLILVGLATLPTTAYQYWAFRSDLAFRERALNPTLSVSLHWVLLGLGIPALLALGMAAQTVWERRKGAGTARRLFADDAALRFLLTWAVAGIAIAYVPAAFQRKMLMGAHLPICLLAGAGLAALSARLPGSLPRIAVLGTILLATPTNLWFLVRDVDRLSANISATPHRPFLTQNESDALRWLRENTRPTDAVLVGPDPSSQRRFPFNPLYPHLSVYVPALAGNVAYNGHWGETGRRFGQTLADMRRFFRADTDDDFRRTLLREQNIRYVLCVNALAGTTTVLKDADGKQLSYAAVRWPILASPPPFLPIAYRNREITICRVVSP